jgi:hypothetical protein
MFGSAAGSMKLREKRDVAIDILMKGIWRRLLYRVLIRFLKIGNILWTIGWKT